MNEKVMAPVSFAGTGANEDPNDEYLRNDYSTIASLVDEFPAIGSVEDCAAFLQVRPDAVRQLCRTGEIQAFKCGTSWRIPRPWLADFIMRGGTHPMGTHGMRGGCNA